MRPNHEVTGFVDPKPSYHLWRWASIRRTNFFHSNVVGFIQLLCHIFTYHFSELAVFCFTMVSRQKVNVVICLPLPSTWPFISSGLIRSAKFCKKSRVTSRKMWLFTMHDWSWHEEARYKLYLHYIRIHDPEAKPLDLWQFEPTWIQRYTSQAVFLNLWWLFFRILIFLEKWVEIVHSTKKQNKKTSVPVSVSVMFIQNMESCKITTFSLFVLDERFLCQKSLTGYPKLSIILP